MRKGIQGREEEEIKMHTHTHIHKGEKRKEIRKRNDQKSANRKRRK